jgi:hypothetical protein
MDEQNMVYPYMEYFSAIKMNDRAGGGRASA